MPSDASDVNESRNVEAALRSLAAQYNARCVELAPGSVCLSHLAKTCEKGIIRHKKAQPHVKSPPSRILKNINVAYVAIVGGMF